MIIYVDENMPPKLAEGLDLLQQPLNRGGIDVQVRSIVYAFGRGTKDEDWIPAAGQQGACILTQDLILAASAIREHYAKSINWECFSFNPHLKMGFFIGIW